MSAILARLFGPGAVILAAVFWFCRSPASLYWFPLLREIVPLAAGGLGLYLAFRFSAVRIFYGLVAVLTAVVSAAAVNSWEAPETFFAVLAFDFLVFSFMPPQRIVSRASVVRTALIAAQFPLVLRLSGALFAFSPGRSFFPFNLPGGPFPFYIAAVAIFLFWRAARGRDAAAAGFFWITAASLVARFLPFFTLSRLLFLAAPLLLLASALEAASEMAFRDRLTGLSARRAMDDFLVRLSPPYAVAMVDIDFFKKFNDTYGHDVGDQVLAKVAAMIAAAGGGGRPFRYGGEEFAIVFPGRDCGDAAPVLEGLRERIEGEGFTVRASKRRNGAKPGRSATPSGKGKKVPLTVSIGVAESGARERPSEVLKKADKALYRAKRQGRNRVVTAPAR